MDEHIKMDYTLEDPIDRVAKTEEIIASTPSERLKPYYLQKMADYVVLAMDKQEKKERKIVTPNRQKYFKENEMSFEGLCENCNDSNADSADFIYNIIANDKNILRTPKCKITEEEIAENPYLQQLQEDIKKTEELEKEATGLRRFHLHKELIEQRKDQYVIRNKFRNFNATVNNKNKFKGIHNLDLSENIWIDADGEVHSDGIINFFDEKHIEMILNNYSALVEDSYEEFLSDSKWMMMDFDALAERALSSSPILERIVTYKIDGRTNEEIRELIKDEFDVTYSTVYISSLWRNKIPKMIAKQAREEWIVWHYTEEEYGKWKRCSCCGEVKLAHKYFFSKNSSSKDGWYSICKVCRSEKNKKKKETEE